ncbi:uncharacterized protein LOC118406877 [Branchiostoma floridae]|uniref:Uncharacterized protein LOC118406877 n=1 Tax=Branchiostoma floridae TaxID=7739 RepID=A0A9J7KK01_BRAFL|nr:uncharacterized protein LOC118406877 [Branchiostoma floridae]
MHSLWLSKHHYFNFIVLYFCLIVLCLASVDFFLRFSFIVQNTQCQILELCYGTVSNDVSLHLFVIFFSGTPIDVITRIDALFGITSVGLVLTCIALAIGLIDLKCLIVIKKMITKETTVETASLLERTAHEVLVIGENSALNEGIEEMSHLGQEESCEQAEPHVDLQEHSLRAESREDIGGRRKTEMQSSSIQTAAVRPKQRSLISQSQPPPSEEDSLEYTVSPNDETVPLLPRGSQEVSPPMDPVFKTGGLEVALHPTPPLKEDADSQSSLTEDAAESSVPPQTLAEELQEAEEQSTEHVPDGPCDAGPQSEPKGLRTEQEDEEETSVKQISDPPEDSEHIPDIEEIARTAMVRVPSDELSFPVQESAHDSDGLEALGAVGGRSESFSPLPTSDVESDAESSSGDEAYERKVRVAIRDSVAKSLFTGLAHHLSNPAGPGPDWVPLARAAGITGPEIDHIINEAAQDLDKDIRKMLEQYEEGKTGDRPISELYGELIARKRLELYNRFRRDPPS